MRDQHERNRGKRTGLQLLLLLSLLLLHLSSPLRVTDAQEPTTVEIASAEASPGETVIWMSP